MCRQPGANPPLVDGNGTVRARPFFARVAGMVQTSPLISPALNPTASFNRQPVHRSHLIKSPCDPRK